MSTNMLKDNKLFKTEVNMDNCRVCMLKHQEMTYIFNTDSDIIEKILYCTGLQITKDDGLPSQICKHCIQDLATAHKFKSSCLLANNTYQDLLKSGIKTEIEYLDSDSFSNELFPVKEELDESVEEEVETELEDSKPRKTVKRGPRGPYKKKLKGDKVKKPKIRKKLDPLCCVQCKIHFKNKAEKEEHMMGVHNNEPYSFVCEHCGKVFNHRSTVYSHARSHLPPQFACEQCDYRATYKHDLVKHQRMHADIKLYQCQHCAARFRTTSHLSQHILREHERVKRFRCRLCPRAFFDRCKLDRHVDSHNNVKRYECEVCHSLFTRRCTWKKHREQKHNIFMPRLRPGRQRAENYILNQASGQGQESENSTLVSVQ